ncbi:MAG: pantothenate kinase [Cyanobacteria bacterium P01_D01_bin.156]
MAHWLALVIGNTRWHCAWFQDTDLRQVWHFAHVATYLELRHLLNAEWNCPAELLDVPLESLAIYAVSVVPSQAEYLAKMPQVQWIKQIPLKDTYPTMGLDRIVSLWGAGQRYGWPVLMIDGGTALTFTAGADACFRGGAIMLGLRSQLKALHDYTAALPQVEPPLHLPKYWAVNTSEAIQAGVLHPLLAGIHNFIHDWQNQYPDTAIIFTGGDGQYLHQLYQQYLEQQTQALNARTWVDPNLMFWGVAAYRSDDTRAL